MMLDTTVGTANTGTGGTYTTTDKLYWLHFDANGSSNHDIYAGTNDSLPVNIKFWKSSSWGRSPLPGGTNVVFITVVGQSVAAVSVTSGMPAVAGALKINLESILFAAHSAISTTAFSGDSYKMVEANGIAEFNLRLKGGSMGGKVIDAGGGKITYTASTDERLVVLAQREDGGTTYQYVKDGTGSSETLDLSKFEGLTTGTTYSAKAWTEKKARCGNVPM